MLPLSPGNGLPAPGAAEARMRTTRPRERAAEIVPFLDSPEAAAHSVPQTLPPPMKPSAQAQAGSPAADAALPLDEQQRRWFAAEVLPHEPALRSWLKARFPTLSDCDDVVQETYARLFRSRSSERITNAKSYLFSTARNLAVDLFRRHRSGPIVAVAELERSAVPEERTGVVDAVASAQELELLRHAIEALPDRCRAIMTMQKLQGLSNAEIAAQLGLSVNTVNAQLVIGLARCRAYLSARGVFRGSSR
jgi:RNA polymerase sigma-70 factor (ECF subfamily)